jgi:stringent starvation protein B
MSHPLPPKKEVALALLERSLVRIHLDPRRDGVIVPANFRKEVRLILEIGLNLPVPIPDLRLDDEGMTCTLSFARQPFYCVVPWSSVFAMVGEDGRGMLWPDDAPAELEQHLRPADPARAARPQPVAAPAPAPSPGAAKKAPAAVASGGDNSTAPAEKPKAKRASRSKKPRVAAVESEPERPVLVALPAPPERKGPRAVPAANKKKSPPSPAHRPNAAPSASPSAGGGKSKRELPPYLRVVK